MIAPLFLAAPLDGATYLLWLVRLHLLAEVRWAASSQPAPPIVYPCGHCPGEDPAAPVMLCVVDLHQLTARMIRGDEAIRVEQRKRSSRWTLLPRQ
jgi:hypothetical protein